MERTLRLIQRAHEGDKEARDILVEENVGLVWSIVRRFQNRGVESEDLFQIGTIGLIKAVDKFDCSYEVCFSTYAVRDTVIDDHEIHQGDYMGIGDAGILAVGQAIETVTKDMIDSMMDEDMELISIYYGQETKEEDAAALRDKVAEKYPACDVELQYGGQPIYYYIVSAE